MLYVLQQADAVVIKAADQYAQLLRQAIQDRSSTIPGVKNGIKLVGNRVPMGNYSTQTAKGSAGPYEYMKCTCVVNGRSTTVSNVTADIAHAPCSEIDKRGGVACSMMRNGWRTSQQRIANYNGEGLLASTPLTAVGLSMAPDFCNKAHFYT